MRYLIVLALCAIAALAYGQSSKLSPQNQAGRYVVVMSNDGAAWRLDTASGGLIYCLTAQKQMNPLAMDQKGRDAVCVEMMK